MGEEITIEILSKLPVESLLRFKCVSEWWNTLISSSYFKRKHPNNANRNHNYHKLLITETRYKNGVPNSSFSCSFSSPDIQVVGKLDLPINYEPEHGKIYCYGDGLFFIGLWSTPSGDGPSILLLWNPSTRESLVLPHPNSTMVREEYTYGLGFDSSSDDYKVLKVNTDNDELNEILSVKNGSWRKLVAPYTLYASCWSNVHMELAFVHGAFHWLGSFSNMVSLNISNETYQEEQLPELMYLTMETKKSGVSVLEGMLCVFYTCRDGSTFNLWMKKEYGVKGSWTKILTVPTIGVPLTIPKYRFPNGEVLLSCDYHGGTAFRTSKGPFIGWALVRDDIREDTILDGYTYTQSLISPMILNLNLNASNKHD